MSDRRVHARSGDGDYEVVRYDRAGKWFIENVRPKPLVPAHQVLLGTAVDQALYWLHSEHGQVFFGLPGGSTFDRKVLARA